MNLISDSNVHKVLFIIGPTAVGKTELSLNLAEQLNGNIVSADSRQVYKYLDIGTAKPTQQERARVPHHFIDIHFPDFYYSAGEYGREARQHIDSLLKNGVAPVVVGGSGFYIQALVDGLYAPAISDSAVKEKWRRRIQEEGMEPILTILKQVDPLSAERLHPNDAQRIIRALEVWELTGKPISACREGDEQPADFAPIFIALNRDRAKLYRRIEARVDQMLRDGLVDEVEHLKNMGYGPELNALRTVGYQEVFDHFSGVLSFADMVETIKRNTRRYAKRQLTWFRRDPRINWIDIDDKNEQQILQCVLDVYNRHTNSFNS